MDIDLYGLRDSNGKIFTKLRQLADHVWSECAG